MAKNKSVEEQVEDIAKDELKKYKLKTYTKTQSINSEIDAAMKKAPSKSGGSGGNYPDIRLLLETKTKKIYPIMIEVKGAKGKLVKLNAHGEIENSTAKGEPNYSSINGFAVNGSVHYANALIDFTETYKEVIAIGINGYQEADGTLKIEIGVYYVSAKNLGVAKKVDEFSDLSFLAPSNFDAFIKKLESELTCEIAVYLIAMMKKAFANFGWGRSSFNVNVLKEVKISLPITADGNPDYDYMTRYIRIQQKLVIRNVVEWKDRELKAYRAVVTK